MIGLGSDKNDLLNVASFIHLTDTSVITVGVAGSVLLLFGLAALAFAMRSKIRRGKQEEERSDVNPVYGTYEVTYDPVAVVRYNA